MWTNTEMGVVSIILYGNAKELGKCDSTSVVSSWLVLCLVYQGDISNDTASQGDVSLVSVRDTKT